MELHKLRRLNPAVAPRLGAMVLLPRLPTRLPVITPGDPQAVQAFWNTDASDALGRRLGQILDASVFQNAWTCLLYTSPSPRDS